MGSMMGRHHQTIMTSMELPVKQYQEWLQQGVSVEELARLAYQAGSDERLRLCVEWLSTHDDPFALELAREMHAAMRPKPPSLKEQALEHLASGCFPYTESIAVIREALESLPD